MGQTKPIQKLLHLWTTCSIKLTNSEERSEERNDGRKALRQGTGARKIEIPCVDCNSTAYIVQILWNVAYTTLRTSVAVKSSCAYTTHVRRKLSAYGKKLFENQRGMSGQLSVHDMNRTRKWMGRSSSWRHNERNGNTDGRESAYRLTQENNGVSPVRKMMNQGLKSAPHVDLMPRLVLGPGQQWYRTRARCVRPSATKDSRQ